MYNHKRTPTAKQKAASCCKISLYQIFEGSKPMRFTFSTAYIQSPTAANISIILTQLTFNSNNEGSAVFRSDHFLEFEWSKK